MLTFGIFMRICLKINPAHTTEGIKAETRPKKPTIHHELIGKMRSKKTTREKLYIELQCLVHSLHDPTLHCMA